MPSRPKNITRPAATPAAKSRPVRADLRVRPRTTAPAAAASPDSRRTVFVAVTGMTPAILTETLWALAHEPTPVVPHRIIVLTTTTGRDAIHRELFDTPVGKHPSVWKAFRATLAAAGHDLAARLQFDPQDIKIFSRPLPNGDTEHLADIRTSADNDTAGDFILRELRGITDDANTRLIASIAGGRKTMGALLYAALSLVGRDTDRLTHVLVNEPYENPSLQPRFYFPAQPNAPHKLHANDGTPAPAKKLPPPALSLADLPFVPLRAVFPRELGRNPGSLTELVHACRTKTPYLNPQPVALTLAARELRFADEKPIHLSPRQATILRFLAKRAKDNAKPFDHLAPVPDAILASLGWNTTPPPNATDEYAVYGDLKNDGERTIIKALDDIKTKLRKHNTPQSHALLAALPVKGRFSLNLDSRKIVIKE